MDKNPVDWIDLAVLVGAAAVWLVIVFFTLRLLA